MLSLTGIGNGFYKYKEMNIFSLASEKSRKKEIQNNKMTEFFPFTKFIGVLEKIVKHE